MSVDKYAARHDIVSERNQLTPDNDEDRADMRMLSRDEFAALLAATTEYWRPLVEFLVASGCRWGEAAALKPSDVDRKAGTVKIRRAWKYNSDGYQIGDPKTRRSKRTINVPAAVLDKVDYSHEWLFVNRDGGPVRYLRVVDDRRGRPDRRRVPPSRPREHPDHRRCLRRRRPGVVRGRSGSDGQALEVSTGSAIRQRAIRR